MDLDHKKQVKMHYSIQTKTIWIIEYSTIKMMHGPINEKFR